MNCTIKEIARAASVSITTVSLVINGGAKAGRIHPDTEKRVPVPAQQVNDVPNKTARRFRTNRRKTVGLVVPDGANPFFSALTFSVQQILFEQNDQLLIGYSNHKAKIAASNPKTVLLFHRRCDQHRRQPFRGDKKYAQ